MGLGSWLGDAVAFGGVAAEPCPALCHLMWLGWWGSRWLSYCGGVDIDAAAATGRMEPPYAAAAAAAAAVASGVAGCGKEEGTLAACAGDNTRSAGGGALIADEHAKTTGDGGGPTCSYVSSDETTPPFPFPFPVALSSFTLFSAFVMTSASI
mmetsp:Transcript_74098/g.140098  ORF Transcript_74098/g.140098 Transcript_74098/m.140098 type:complete len:153 (+) Transcript_74098:857-1315(+)